MRKVPNSGSRGLSPATQFTDPAAVEAWDRWFRWRDGAILRDLTIDATWQRVADAIAAVEGRQAPTWACRFVDAFSRWRILPDPRLLRLAGTGSDFADLDQPGAAINVAAFVTSPGTPRANFDRDRFVEAATLAIRLLDDVLIARNVDLPKTEPRIGIIGLADALHQLKLPYESSLGRDFSKMVASALAEGTLRGEIELSDERGSEDGDRTEMAELSRKRGAPAWLVDEVLRSGLRHRCVTAIEPQPHLALLANNASDALDPRPGNVDSGATRESSAPGHDSVSPAPILAQIELRAAIQPWIDSPIDYPLVCTTEPDSDTIEALQRLTAKHGLRRLVLRPARTLL